MFYTAAADLCGHCCTGQRICQNKAHFAGPKSWTAVGFPPGAPPEPAPAGSSPQLCYTAPIVLLVYKSDARKNHWGKYDRSVRSSCGALGWVGLSGFFHIWVIWVTWRTQLQSKIWHIEIQTCHYSRTLYDCHTDISQSYHVFRPSHDRFTHHEKY